MLDQRRFRDAPGQRVKRHFLVAAAENEHRRLFHRRDGLLCGIDIRSLGIVDPCHAVQLPHRLDAVFHALEGFEHFAHRFAGNAHHAGDDHSGQRVFKVVWAGDIHLVAKFQNDVMIRDIRTVRHLLLAGEPCHLRLQPLRHLAAGRIVVIEHGHVMCGLAVKDTPLHRDIDFHRAMADDMILGDIEYRAHMRVELADALALIAAHLGDSHVILFGYARRRGNRIADVSDDVRRASRRAKQLADQRRGRRLAVRAGDGDKRALCQPRAQLQFAHDLHTLRNRVLHKRLGPRNAGADDHDVLPCNQAVRRLAERKRAFRRAQFIQRAAEFAFRLGIRDGHTRAKADQQLGRRNAAARHAADQHALSFNIHVHGLTPPFIAEETLGCCPKPCQEPEVLGFPSLLCNDSSFFTKRRAA